MATQPKPTDIDQDDELDAEAQKSRVLEQSRTIITRLDAQFQDQYRARLNIEERWLEDLRNYHGRYLPAQEAQLKGEVRSTVFVNLTREKTKAWEARLGDMLFPTDDKNWGIKPTPLPQLAEAAKKAIAERDELVKQANAAAQVDPAQGALLAEQADAYAQEANASEEQIEEAKKRAERMETVIHDQLVETDYPARARDVIGDGCRIGTGIFKGPVTSNRIRQEWRQEKLGWKLTQIPDPIPEGVRVDPWHFFPDMSARTIEEAEFTYERSLPSKKDLRRMALKFGFSRDAVERLLKTGPMSLPTQIDHIGKLRDLTGEGEQIKDRYVMLEYHGTLECDEIAILLRAMGKEDEARAIETEKDPFTEHRVIVHYIDNEVLKIAPDYPLDSGETLYSVWNFEKGETSIFGVGVPYLARDPQSIINGATRMLMDNAALSVSGQVLIDRSAVSPQDKKWGLRPYKVWLMDTTALMGSAVPPFQVIPIPNNQEALAGIVQLGKTFLDEQVSMPLIAQGEQGSAAGTLGGMSMLFNSANVVFRRVIKSWDDDLTKPMIRRFYHWNMQFNADDGIKGDMQVDARGTSVLLVREIQSQNLMAIVTNWSVHPVVAPWLQPKMRSIISKTLQTMMIDPADAIASQEEYDQAMADAAKAAAEGGGEGDAEHAGKMEQLAFERETKLLIAKADRENRLIDVAARNDMSVMQLDAMLKGKELEVGAKERMHAADIGVEEVRRQEALASGTPPEDAVGKGVG